MDVRNSGSGGGKGGGVVVVGLIAIAYILLNLTVMKPPLRMDIQSIYLLIQNLGLFKLAVFSL